MEIVSRSVYCYVSKVAKRINLFLSAEYRSMCGICGYISKTEYPLSILRKMNDSMVYRGPDDSGEEILRTEDKHFVGLAQRRLSIIDLSDKGHQPMYSAGKDLILTFNGEIYNYKEIRKELEKKGRVFRSDCDTEVLLQAYEEYGIEALDLLNGMFAVALFDKKSETLLLARDRMGKKPLYYYAGAKSFVWGSELKPLMLHPEFYKEIRTELISRYLCYKYIKSPDTIFKNTYKVEPGEYVLYHKGEISKAKYWNILGKYEDAKNSRYHEYADAKINLKNLLKDSVKRRMVADVPVGAFLSGGIDSTLVTALAQSVSDRPVKSFSIGFETAADDEAIYAKEIAKRIGTDHTELYISQNELLKLVREIPKYYDEPFADSSQIPTMAVSRLAAEQVKVVLSGDGGDELFCGYNEYDWERKSQLMDIPGAMFYYLGGRLIKDRLPDRLYALMMNRNPDYKVQLFQDVRQRYTRKLVLGDSAEAKFDTERYIQERNWQIKRMLLDMQTYLPDEILCKVDRATMSCSIEGRNPILDYRIVEESFRIPHRYKYQNGIKKHILKDITYDYVGKSLLDRPKKGFSIPLKSWMNEHLSGEIDKYCNKEILKRQGIFDADEIVAFASRLPNGGKDVYPPVMWAYLMFQMWYQEYIEDLW